MRSTRKIQGALSFKSLITACGQLVPVQGNELKEALQPPIAHLPLQQLLTNADIGRRTQVMRISWAFLGLVSLALGVVGIFLPLLPTTPFLLLAAFCFARSSERLHRWLLAHPIFGPIIENWRRHRAIARSAKVAATIGCGAIFAILLVLKLPVIGLLAQAFVLLCVLTFIWTRTEPE